MVLISFPKVFIKKVQVILNASNKYMKSNTHIYMTKNMEIKIQKATCIHTCIYSHAYTFYIRDREIMDMSERQCLKFILDYTLLVQT